MRFLFKYASRGRPEWFKETICRWFDMLSGKHEYKFVVSIDEDDTTMNNVEMKAFCAAKPNLELCIGQSKNKIAAINADMEERDFDILVVVSDDMIPVVQNFDDIIAEDMQKHFPYLDGALSYKDDCRNDHLITLTIIGKRLYDHFGYIYRPEYKSVWCDNEFTDVVNEMGKVKYLPGIIIRHEWMKNGQDAIYARNGIDFYQDKATYLYRKERGFPK